LRANAQVVVVVVGTNCKSGSSARNALREFQSNVYFLPRSLRVRPLWRRRFESRLPPHIPRRRIPSPLSKFFGGTAAANHFSEIPGKKKKSIVRAAKTRYITESLARSRARNALLCGAVIFFFLFEERAKASFRGECRSAASPKRKCLPVPAAASAFFSSQEVCSWQFFVVLHFS